MKTSELFGSFRRKPKAEASASFEDEQRKRAWGVGLAARELEHMPVLLGRIDEALLTRVMRGNPFTDLPRDEARVVEARWFRVAIVDLLERWAVLGRPKYESE